jgi:hypothetical protein
LESLKGRHYLEKLGVDRKTILKWVYIKKVGALELV